jgi:hypothetical protein
MKDKKWLLYAGLVLAGYVFAPQISKIPLLSKIPQV